MQHLYQKEILPDASSLIAASLEEQADFFLTQITVETKY